MLGLVSTILSDCIGSAIFVFSAFEKLIFKLISVSVAENLFRNVCEAWFYAIF